MFKYSQRRLVGCFKIKGQAHCSNEKKCNDSWSAIKVILVIFSKVLMREIKKYKNTAKNLIKRHANDCEITHTLRKNL